MEQCICGIICTIVVVREPLPVAALAELQHTQSAVRFLRSVIREPLCLNDALRILQPSFIDFITSKDWCTDERFLVDFPAREMILAQRCLELMVDALR